MRFDKNQIFVISVFFCPCRMKKGKKEEWIQKEMNNNDMNNSDEKTFYVF